MRKYVPCELFLLGYITLGMVKMGSRKLKAAIEAMSSKEMGR
jgi:hypothetical protein